jgi:hypothetical protein
MNKILVFPLSIAVIGVACGKPAEPTSPAASATPTAETPSETEAPPADSSEPGAEPSETDKPVEKKDLTGCEKHFAEFDKILATATYACKKDADCGCFDVQVSRVPGNECGGVVEKTIAKKLDTISQTAKKESCATSAMCDAWTCDPVCDSGQCRKTPKKK